MAARGFKYLVCYGCKGKSSSGRCYKCGRTYCLDCFYSHSYFLCTVTPAKGYPLVVKPGA